jgi:DNA-binding NtrC family response regulator
MSTAWQRVNECRLPCHVSTCEVAPVSLETSMARILVVDDESTIVLMVAELLRADGHEVSAFNNGNAALAALEEHQPELVITDLNLDPSSKSTQGLDILKKARGLNPPAEVVVITAFGSVGTAVEAMRQGAYDFLEKPFKVEDFRACTQRALLFSRAVAENHFLRKQLNERYRPNQFVGTSPRMQEIFRLIERVADSDSTILILGQSGTGKELVARALHFNSRRQFAPFVPVNCAALPETLLESELFGHRRGAFIGAIADKRGLFQEADGGTIFLDEIGSMPPALQSRLLRVLQDREVRCVGDNTPSYVNVRVLAATNEPLEDRIREGTFREDLYYRLNVIPIQLPELRERREDIPLLVANFLRKKASLRTGEPIQITRNAMDALSRYNWPGNVRELENAVERAVALCEQGTIQLQDLPARVLGRAASDGPGSFEPACETISAGDKSGNYPLHGPSTAATGAEAAASQPGLESLKDFIRHQEVLYLNRTLALSGGNKEKAAELLGISLATLYRKLTEESAA